MWKSVPTLFVQTGEISGLSQPGLTNHHCTSGVMCLDVKVLEFQSLQVIFSCILTLFIILIKLLTTKSYDSRTSGDWHLWLKVKHVKIDPGTMHMMQLSNLIQCITMMRINGAVRHSLITVKHLLFA